MRRTRDSCSTPRSCLTGALASRSVATSLGSSPVNWSTRIKNVVACTPASRPPRGRCGQRVSTLATRADTQSTRSISGSLGHSRASREPEPTWPAAACVPSSFASASQLATRSSESGPCTCESPRMSAGTSQSAAARSASPASRKPVKAATSATRSTVVTGSMTAAGSSAEGNVDMARCGCSEHARGVARSGTGHANGHAHDDSMFAVSCSVVLSGPPSRARAARAVRAGSARVCGSVQRRRR